MKQINLVPLSIRQKAVSRKAVPYIVFAGLLGLGAAGAAWAGFTLQNRILTSQRDALIQQEIELQAAANKELATLKIDTDLTTRVAQLNTLASTDVNWRRAFNYLALLLPKEIVLTTFTYATGNNTITLKLTGDAPSNLSYATFAEYLKSEAGKSVTSYKVDGYNYDSKTGHVIFSMTLVVPRDQVNFVPAT